MGTRRQPKLPNPLAAKIASELMDVNALAGLDDPSLKSTWSHRAWTATGFATLLICIAKCISRAAHSNTYLQTLFAAFLGYVLADLLSAFYHWGIDNYGTTSTPIFGPHIRAFQAHHKDPMAFTKFEFANNMHVVARTMAFVLLPFDLFCNDPAILGFVGVWSGCIMFIQQIHAWAHRPKTRLPYLVVALQDLGLLLSRTRHVPHHLPPYSSHYCTVNGMWNEFLYKHKVFEAFEWVVFLVLGVRPRWWNEPKHDGTEETDLTPSHIIPKS